MPKTQQPYSAAFVLLSLIAVSTLTTSPTYGGVRSPKSEPADAELVANPRPEVMQGLLRRWEDAFDASTGIVGEYSRSEFDEVFAIERQSAGAFCIKSAYEYRVIESSSEVPNQAVSKRRNRMGEPYRIDSFSGSSCWIRTNNEVRFLDVENKGFAAQQIPEELRGTVAVPVPFYFLVKPTDLARHFHLSLAKCEKGQISILAVPLSNQTGKPPANTLFGDFSSPSWYFEALYPNVARASNDRTSFLITLDRATFRPIRIRSSASSSSRENDYTFHATIGFAEKNRSIGSP